MWDEQKLKGKSIFRDEKTPSMIWYKQGNCFKDFSSGQTFDIIDFYTKKEGLTFVNAVKALFDLVGFEYSDEDFSEYSTRLQNYRFPKDEPENDRFVVEQYMMARGISIDTLDYAGVKQDEHGNIAFQMFLPDGTHVQTKYRVSRPAKNGEFKWFWQKNTDNCPVLYGIEKIDTTKPMVIVEGLIDRLAVIESGMYNVVSIPGGANDLNWIDFNYDVLEKEAEIILWFDDDKPGQDAVKEAATRLGLDRCKIVSPTKEVKQKIGEYYAQYHSSIDKVDANNVLVACGKDDVLKLINDAKMIENSTVKRLMEFEELELQDIKKTSTGFKAMDAVFSGVYDNQLTIITGAPGSGKSQLINTMFVASPIENGEKVFIYSGELPPRILLGNILKPLASRRHILRFENPGRPDGYKITNEASKTIKRYYMDNIYVYDEEKELDTDSISILENMIYSYKRYGVTNFIVDSLLTVDCSKEIGDDEYKKEATFVKKLKTFTNKYPVKVCLIIHTRKLPVGQKGITGDDISGSSSHNKLCDRSYSISRIYDDPEGFSTEIKCLKDRVTGLVGKSCKLKYDFPSYRLYSDDEELNREYSWEKNIKIDYPESMKPQIVSNIKEVKKTVEHEVFG